ncbi:hypothetical protein BS78_02G062300 [Paspalum vaginatum]|nr:hypothetical protein BS78_02G062300 [Paspalum vaginatum]
MEMVRGEWPATPAPAPAPARAAALVLAPFPRALWRRKKRERRKGGATVPRQVVAGHPQVKRPRPRDGGWRPTRAQCTADAMRARFHRDRRAGGAIPVTLSPNVVASRNAMLDWTLIICRWPVGF